MKKICLLLILTVIFSWHNSGSKNSGTFSGTITNSNNEDIIITSGEFYVPIKN
ncbi:hypothetical protein EV196_10925 [Mariniflexile fucanivorans]|uniref:Uncharacterized protein n=1 Tax=Mariniflexile fucanivorans TaxID=264023 RepID=A0A4R1RC47_9FLAO|nr:hypothetical protein EV196_10925 [Mariniflexile fucanivorans]